MKRSKEEAQKTREKILRAALEAIVENGYERTSLVDIAKAADVTRGAIYWHFKNKKEILKEILDDLSKPYIDNLTKILNKDLPAHCKLYLLIYSTLNIVVNDEDQVKYRLICYSEDTLIKDTIEFIKEIEHKMTNLIYALIDAGQSQGTIRKDISTDIVANIIYVYFVGLEHLVLFDKYDEQKQVGIDKVKELINVLFFSCIFEKNVTLNELDNYLKQTE